MFRWRVTKYAPRHRDGQGIYRREEWIAASDIGKSFGGVRLTRQEYLRVESAYAAAMLCFFEESGLDSLLVQELEDQRRWSDPVGDGLVPPQLQLGQRLSREELEAVARAVLREVYWCKLGETGRFYAHFGRDYYMYLGSSAPSPGAIAEAERLGLFVERCRSPYE